jgi:Leucine-rich repeat (LRR) protein
MKKKNTILLLVGVFAAVLLATVIVILKTQPGTVSTTDDSGATPETPSVYLTVTGASFSPVVELSGGSDANLTWRVEESGDVYSGLSPGIVFGSPTVRHVRLTAMDSDGSDALGDIVTFNLGFDSVQDAGKYNIGSGYDHHPQEVSRVEGVRHMKGLLRFLAATPSLTGPVDFSGMSRLQYIECFGAGLTSVDLTGCDSLIRLCLENNDLASIDLNPVSGNLCDLRLSGNRDTVTMTPLQSPMRALYHYCAQSITVVNHPSPDQLPAVEELWDWKSGQSGELIIRSTAIRSVLTYENGWTSADLTNQFPAASGGYLDAHGCRLSSIKLTGCSGLVFLDLHDNQLGQAAVDGILAEVASWGTYGGSLNLLNNEHPSPAGMNSISILQGRGWSVAY